MTTFIATAAIVLQWLLLLATVLGLGTLVSRFARPRIEETLSVPARTWVGLAVACSWLYLIHLFVPLHDPVAWVPLLFLALAGLVPAFVGFRRKVQEGIGLVKEQTWILVVLFVLALFVAGMANQALKSPVWSDTYIYHLNAIDFYAQFPAIKGLANLHNRYGFQSSTLLLSAASDIGIWKGEGFRLVNGFLFTLLSVEVVYRLVVSVTRRTVSLGTAFLFLAVTLLVSLDPVRVPEAVLAAPNLDIGAAVLFIVAMTYFIDSVERPTKSTVFLALVIASLSATFRPVNLLTAVIVTAVLLILVVPPGSRKRWIRMPLVASAVIVGAGMLHTTVLSGYPLFPFSFPYLGFDWSLPQDETRAIADAVTNWARFGAYGITEYEWTAWIKSWLAYMWHSGQVRDWGPTIFSGFLGIALIAFGSGRRSQAKLLLVLSCPVLPALVVWFYSAPDIRFAYGPLIATGAIPLAIALLPSTRAAWDRGARPSSSGRPALYNPWAAAAACLLVVVCWGPAIDRVPDPVRAGGNGVLGSLEPTERELIPFNPPGDWIRWSAALGQSCGRELRCVPLPYPERSVIFRGDDITDGFRRAPLNSTD